uniref:Uncharacterized protein n=1 Tax=Homo sapiens TaxID=9606 RepID=Q8WZ11_HUMAN|nr:unknown [Homo sapiens]
MAAIRGAPLLLGGSYCPPLQPLTFTCATQFWFLHSHSKMDPRKALFCGVPSSLLGLSLDCYGHCPRATMTVKMTGQACGLASKLGLPETL